MSTTRFRSSPLARRLAAELGIELALVVGSGPDGRIRARDIPNDRRGGLSPAPAPTARRTIAARMTAAWAAPAFQLSSSADASAVVRLRQAFASLEHGAQPTITDLLVKVSAGALVRHHEVNALFVDDEVRLEAKPNIGIAVDCARGLVVPVIRNAERLTLDQIVNERVRLVADARSGSLSAKDLADGTFTISNLGMFGVERFTAILNPPQVAILAVGKVKEVLELVQGAVAAVPRIELTLTCDHRALDGATGAAFLRTFVELLEEPALAL